MQHEIAKEIENALNQDLKADFPNAPRLGMRPVDKHPETPTSRDRIGKTIEELSALVQDLNTLIVTLGTIKSKL
jgi:hypothetical protein